MRRKIKTKDQRIRRQKKSITSFKSLIAELKKKDLIDSRQQESFSGLSLKLFEDEFKNSQRHPCGYRYCNDVAKFAISLHYYSPKAYKLVRSVLHLPHPSTIRAWASNVDCSPGILENVFHYLSKAIERDPRMRECSLIADEMSIRKLCEWDSSR